MAEQDLLNALDDCIDRLAAGQNLEDCLSRYPQYASALRPMLEIGNLVNRARFSPPEIRESQDRVRVRVTEALNTRHRRPRPLLLRTFPLVASFVIIFALALATTSILAESSLPGDPLYGLKRLTESARLLMLANGADLEHQFDQRRIQEVEQLVGQRRAAQVTFEGELEAVNGSAWQVAGLPVRVAPVTPGAASAQPGDTIEVQASTTVEGEIVATTIRKISGDEPVPTVVPPTGIPTQTLSRTPDITPTGTSTPTPSPAMRPSSTPTVVTRILPSATTCVSSQPIGWIEYSVQPDDNLSSLAAATGITLEELVRVNCLTDQNLIVTGQRLYLPFEPRIIPTQTRPEVRSTEVEDRDNSGPGSSNSGQGGGDDDSRDEDDNSGQGSDDDDSERGGNDT
jgi:hypothetical protein